MAFLDAPFRLALGNGEPRYYPAHVPIKDRADPGLRFELAQGQPWRWSGKDGPIEVELVDVLAAATLETLSGIQVLRGPILSMHALAQVTSTWPSASGGSRRPSSTASTSGSWASSWSRPCATGRSRTTSSTRLSGSHRLSRSSATARRSGCGLARKPGRGSRPGQASPGEAV